MKQPLSDSIQDYLQHKRSKRAAAGTLKNIDMVLRRFLTLNGNIHTWSIDGSHVDRHMLDAEATRPKSMGIDVAALRGFFNWARATKRMARDSDPMWEREAPKHIVEERRRVPRADFPRLLDAAEEHCPRDRVLVAHGLYLMLRQSEIKTLRIRDLDLRSTTMRVKIHKSKKFDVMPISAELDKELRAWLTTYTSQCGALHPDWYLVPSRWAHRGIRNPETGLLERGVNDTLRPDYPIGQPERPIQRALSAIGFPLRDEVTGESLREGEHTLRRSGARALFEELSARGDVPDPLGVVQSMLHHAQRSQTERYIGLDGARVSRDAVIAGRAMYPVDDTNVVHMKERWGGAVRNEASSGV